MVPQCVHLAGSWAGQCQNYLSWQRYQVHLQTRATNCWLHHRTQSLDLWQMKSQSLDLWQMKATNCWPSYLERMRVQSQSEPQADSYSQVCRRWPKLPGNSREEQRSVACFEIEFALESDDLDRYLDGFYAFLYVEHLPLPLCKTPLNKMVKLCNSLVPKDYRLSSLIMHAAKELDSDSDIAFRRVRYVPLGNR